MACNSLENILKDCENNRGGLQEMYLWDMDDQTSYVGNSGTFSVTELVIGAAPNSYFLKRNTANFTEETAADFNTGNTLFTLTVNLMFLRREASKSKSVKIMGDGQRYLGGLILDANGKYWVAQDLQLSTGGEGSGTAKTDGSKYSVVLTAIDNDTYMYELDSTLAAAFISTGTTI